MTPEAKVKKYLREECKKRGWQCLPLKGPRNWQDYTILIPFGVIVFVEVKAQNADLSTDHVNAQKRKINELIDLGFPTYMIKGIDGNHGAKDLLARMDTIVNDFPSP